MSRGRRIVAPRGWGSILSTDFVYFLHRSSEIVTLVEFYQLSNQSWRTHFKFIPNARYEELLKREILVTSKNEKHLPPWFPEGVDFEWSDRRARSNEAWLRAARNKYSRVEKACTELKTWLASHDPEIALNKYAVANKQNTARFRLDTLTYLIFGPEISVLQRRTWSCGKYIREGDGVPLGRASLFGEKKAKRLGEDDKAIFRKAYRKFKSLKKNMTEIHCELLVHYYGVGRREIIKNSDGYKKILCANGRAFPTLRQFTYWARTEIGSDQIYRDRFGSERSRNRKEKKKGRYSEECSNLMEVVERDAYYMREIPRGFESKHLPKMCVVHLVDRLSSGIVGVGFSHGGEDAEAYRMAEFCAAIDKSTFCRLLGIEEFDPDDWPMIGVPPETVTDRGPGSNVNIQSVFAELTPSYSPQSKPAVESSNPKDDKVSGKPVFVDSGLRPIELMRRAVRNVIEYNCTRNIGYKIPNRMIEDRPLITPSGLWIKMDKVSRNNARLMSWQNAVRTYLRKGVATVSDSELIHRRQSYFCVELLETELLGRIGSEIEIYYLPAVLRQIWVETESGLLEIPALLAFQDDEDQLYVTDRESIGLLEIRNQLDSQWRDHTVAVRVEHENELKSDTGKGRRPGRVTAGKAKNKSALARKEKAWVES